MASDGTRRGRRSKPHKMADGTEVHGLYHRPDGRWKIVATGELFTEHDERRAVQKFRDWEARNNPTKTVLVEGALTDSILKAKITIPCRIIADPPYADPPYLEPPHTVPTRIGYEIPEAIALEWVREQLINNTVEFAKKLGMPELAALERLAFPKTPLSLAKIIEVYQTQNPSLSKSKRQALAVFECLTKSAKATTLADLTQDAILAWREEIERTIDGPQTRKYYYGCIKTIISFGLKMGLEPVQIRAALDRCAVLWTGEKIPVPCPYPHQYR